MSEVSLEEHQCWGCQAGPVGGGLLVTAPCEGCLINRWDLEVRLRIQMDNLGIWEVRGNGREGGPGGSDPSPGSFIHFCPVDPAIPAFALGIIIELSKKLQEKNPRE